MFSFHRPGSFVLIVLLIAPMGFSDSYRAAILDEPRLPIEGYATPVTTFLETLPQEGVEVTALHANSLSDPAQFNREKYDLLVIPTGASFPLSARETLIAFLRNGGDLLCTGGYAFDSLFVRENDEWISYKKYWAQQQEEARDPQKHMVQNGGFEAGAAGWTTLNPSRCTVVETDAPEGKHCAQVANTATEAGARWEKELPVQPGETYLIGAHARTEDIQGSGYGYLAAYQYDSRGNLIRFIDFIQLWKTQYWKRYETLLPIDRQAARVIFYGGLFQAAGTLWFDSVTCAPMPKEERINAHYGNPQDGLQVDAEQLTLFSPDQPIAGTSLRVNDSRMVDWRSPGIVEGFEATSQLRYNARWIPWLVVLDERGWDTGVAGAVVDHYRGPFARSRWAIFGMTNRDVFAGKSGQELLKATIRKLRGNISFHTLTTEYPLYRRGETVTIQPTLQNFADETIPVSLQVQCLNPESKKERTVLYSQTQSLTLSANSVQTLKIPWTIPSNAPGFVLLNVLVKESSGLNSRMESGICIADDSTMRKGQSIRYKDNAFELQSPKGDIRRVCLWGTDTYGNMFSSPSHSPWTWYRDLQMMRDYGLHLYENLQFIPKNHQYTELQWRQMEAIIQLSQYFGLPYMAGLLIGQDVVVDDDILEQQAEMCRQFAARFSRVPGLIYYLNGDFQLRLKDTADIRRLWNDFLRQRYTDDEALRKAWPPNSVEGRLGEIPVRDYYAQSWFDVKARDLNLFRIKLMNRWIGALCKAIRQKDNEHPITSEYYQRPYSGIDLRLSLGDMDASNFGYFDRPLVDITRLMATIKWNDMRFYGKTVNIGEFGVKTHDAWKEERGGTHYHIHRTPAQQQQLFWWVAHTALSLGVTKIQNWCWGDDPDSIFPWGIAWNNPARPKPAALLYRNLRFLAEQMQPQYSPAEVIFMMPDNWRLGAPENLGHTSLLNALECLLAANIEYDVADESQIGRFVSNPPKLLIVPLAYALADETIERLKNLAEGGCQIYLSGDPGIDSFGRRNPQRLHTLCGVDYLDTANHPSGLPVSQVKALSAEVVDNPAGIPLYRNNLGQGKIIYTPEPWETFPGTDIFVERPEMTSSIKTNLYLSLLPLAGIQPPVTIESSTGVWRSSKTTGGDRQWLSLLPRSPVSTPATVSLTADNHRYRFEFQQTIPAGILSDSQNPLLAVTGNGKFFLDSKPVIDSNSSWISIGLDQRSITESETLLACTMEGGRIWWRNYAAQLSATPIEWRDGQLRPLNATPLQSIDGGWEIDTEPNVLYLIAPETKLEEKAQWLNTAYTDSAVFTRVPSWPSNP